MVFARLKIMSGKEQEAECKCTRNMDDAEIPCLHRELRQQRKLNARPIRDRQAIQRDHVEGSIKRR